MTAEIANLASYGSLSGSITSGASVLCLRSGYLNWPTNLSGQFRAFCDQELFLLQGGSGPVFNILERGAENTEQMAHNDWAEVNPNLTPQASFNLTGGVNDQSGNNSYTFNQVDRAALVSFYGSGAVSGVLPGATLGDTSLFSPHWWTVVANYGASGLSITATSGSTINGTNPLTLSTDQASIIYSDGSGYKAVIIGQGAAFALTSGIITSGYIGDNAVLSGNIGSGQIAAVHLQSGIILPGTGVSVAFGLSGITISASGGSAVLTSGQVTSGYLGNNSVVSGSIASGQIASQHLANSSVLSGNLGSGQVAAVHIQSGTLLPGPGISVTPGLSGILITNLSGSFALTSGIITSGLIGDSAVVSGGIASGQIGRFHFSSGIIVSGVLASGAYTLIAGAGITVAATTPNAFTITNASGSFALTSGIIVSGLIGNNAVNSGNVSSGAIGQFHHASGSVTSGHVGNGAVVSGSIASGTVGSPHIASGQIQTYHHSSGSTAPQSMGLLFYSNSGEMYTAVTEEPISGIRAVQISQSGYLRIAMASVSGRWPALGIVIDNVASGLRAPVYGIGTVQIPLAAASGIVDFSGYLGRQLVLGRSGHVVTDSGGFNSGGLVAGDAVQPLGSVGINSGQINLNVEDPLLFNQVQSGNIASGVVGRFHLSSGIVVSGVLSSGAFQVAAGVGISVTATAPNVLTVANLSGSFALTSGIIVSGLIGNNAVNSGNIASGAIGRFHLSSGIVVSGVMSSGAFTILAGTGITVAATTPNAFTITNASGSFALTSGIIVSGLIGNNAVNSGNISSGQIGQMHIANGGVLSGNIGSGQIAAVHIQSGTLLPGPGISITPGLSGILISNTSGSIAIPLVTEEDISGVRAVQISQSGYLRIAMASVSGRMPAVGILIDNVASGATGNFYSFGKFQFASGLTDFTGALGQTIYVGRSGHLVPTSGSWNSGGFILGDTLQTIGYPYNSGGLILV
ncbi:hypothetical protein C4577_07525 [Candidatus Parcubacteria bacterium]|nr:MAG: hypothetical protein C4577_07525 [Candidatus Parcubacteria bacterium]